MKLYRMRVWNGGCLERKASQTSLKLQDPTTFPDHHCFHASLGGCTTNIIPPLPGYLHQASDSCSEVTLCPAIQLSSSALPSLILPFQGPPPFRLSPSSLQQPAHVARKTMLEEALSTLLRRFQIIPSYRKRKYTRYVGS